MFVTVTDKMPVQGAIAEGEILGSFTGPGNKGQVIKIKAKGKEPVGKYVVIQMRTNGRLNLAEVKVVCGSGPPSCPTAQVAKIVHLSTVHPSYPGENCLDGNPNTFCQTRQESRQNPFLVLEYYSRVSVPEVVVTNRADCCGDRTKNMFVTVTDKMPVQGAIAEGKILGSFTGPAKRGQVITIRAKGKPPVGKYVVIQMRTNGQLNLAEVKVECAGCQKATTKGKDYRGDVSVTKSGKTCQAWDQQSPHTHPVFTEENKQESGLGEHNYCRNPNEPGGVWCYTTDSDKRWEYCPVPFCEALEVMEGVDYVGDYTSSTVKGGVSNIPTWEKCCEMCQKDPDCAYWSWRREGSDAKWNHRCHLKTSRATKQTLSGMVSGGPASCNHKEEEEEEYDEMDYDW